MAAVPIGPQHNPIDELVSKLESSVKLIGWIKAFMVGGFVATIVGTVAVVNAQNRIANLETDVSALKAEKAAKDADHEAIIRIETNVKSVKEDVDRTANSMEDINRYLRERQK